MGTQYLYRNPYPHCLGRVWTTHLLVDMGRIFSIYYPFIRTQSTNSMKSQNSRCLSGNRIPSCQRTPIYAFSLSLHKSTHLLYLSLRKNCKSISVLSHGTSTLLNIIDRISLNKFPLQQVPSPSSLYPWNSPSVMSTMKIFSNQHQSSSNQCD